MKKNGMKKWLALGMVSLMGVSMFACDNNTDGDGDTSAAADGYAYMAIDINPTVEFVLQANKVVSVDAVNDDAAVLVSEEELVRAAREEIEKLLVGVETHKENLQKTTEDAFKEREEKYKDDFDKEAEEPEGGFEAWQDEKEEEFEKDWQGKKEDWKETLNKHFGGKNHE